jgi:hypothetical protein
MWGAGQRAWGWCEPGTETTLKIPPELLTERGVGQCWLTTLVDLAGFVLRYQDAAIVCRWQRGPMMVGIGQ